MVLGDINSDERYLPEAERARREALRRPPILRMVGVDLGQSSDPTAITALEFRADVVTMHGLERLPLGTPYTHAERQSVVGRVCEIMALPALSGAHLLIDRTGVGRAVYDLFIERGLKPIAINITGGNVVHPVPGGFNVPKRDLVFALVALFQAKQLRIPANLPETPILVRELENFKMKIKAGSTHDSYEAWREGDHDDLVLAASLPCWYANYRYNTRKPRRKISQRWA